MDVEDAENLSVMNQRDTECGLDVDAFTQQIVFSSIGTSAQMDRPTLHRHPAGNSLPHRDTNLRPEFGLDALCDAHPENLRVVE